ncbi:TolC family protein [Sunxiuqinia dokdonensis]|uniref:Transporter n=1 Tax=Sunxiuqinia dokdonensis TaxID=1409788 RepID=A0A0L8V2E5_9BACT|nr:TolC family protein [Sunxiuqinia dokdonensis]KOH42553.1 hypothetical protein NC99_46410 [Sunxiuqinia dokdonensis]
MKNRKQMMMTVLASLFLLQGVLAQDHLSIDLQGAKEHALQFNRSIRSSELSVRQSQEQLKQAIAAGLPQVNATTDYNNSLGAEISIQFEENMPASQIPIDPTSSFNLQVGQLIFSANYWVGLHTAKLYRNLSEKNLERTERDIVSQVVNSYYLVLVAGESLQILESNVENLEAVYEKTKPMVEFGMTEKVELDQLSVQLNSLKNAVKSAGRQYEMAQNMLRLQLGVSSETELELTETLTQILNSNEFDSMQASAFVPDQNIDFQLMSVQEQMQEKQVDMQKANYLPTVSGYYSFTQKILKPAFDMTPNHMIGLQMNIPIFSSGERRSKVRQAKIELETVQNERALLEDQLDIQYKQLSFNLRSALDNFENQSRNIEVSREVYENLQRKFNQGLISSLELTSADNNYLKAESDYLQAALEVLQARNELKTLLGEIK